MTRENVYFTLLLLCALTTAYFAGERRVLMLKIRWLVADRDRLILELQKATDRLISSWKDGYTVPPADGDAEPEERAPMDAETQEFLSQWDGAARAHWERFVAQRRAAGRTARETLADAHMAVETGQANLLQPQLSEAVPY